jgi:hypothetical protein
MLCGFATVHQVAIGDCLSFDPFSFDQNGLAAAKVDAGWRFTSTSIELSDEEIQDILITANLTPRKCLGFRTPFQGSSKSLAKTSKFGFHNPLHLAPASTLGTQRR